MGVEARRGFVEHQHLWAHRKHPGDGDPPLLATGERERRAGGQVPGLEQVQRLADALSHLLLGEPEPPRGEGHVLLDGRREEGLLGRLEDEPDATPELGPAHGERILPVHEGPAGGRDEQQVEVLDQGALARAGAPDHAAHLPRLDAHGDAL